MTRFVFLGCAVLALGFYELSGGSDFDPDAQRDATIDARLARAAERQETIVAALSRPNTPAAQNEPVAAAPADTVTRSTLNLVAFQNVTPVEAQTSGPEPAATEQPQAFTSATIGSATIGAATIDRASIANLATEVANTETPLSLASLNAGADRGTDTTVAFAGTRQVATSTNASPASDIRRIKGDLVNLRSGPGTDYDIIDQLPQATEVEVLYSDGNGWVELRTVGGTEIGWIAEFLLTGG